MAFDFVCVLAVNLFIIFDEQRKVPAQNREIYYGCENQYSPLYILDRDKVTE